MREEYGAFIVSVLLGTMVGIVGSYNFNKIPGGMLETFFFNKYIAGISLVAPILVLVLSFILSTKFPLAWGRIGSRLFCIISLLIVYMFGVTLGIIPSVSITNKFSLFSELSFAFFVTLYFSFGLAIMPFLYSNILTIGAAYVITEGIEPRRRRIILAFVLIFLICMASASPLAHYAAGA